MNEPTDPQMLEALRRDREAPAPDDARARVASRLGVSGPLPSEAPLHPRRATAAKAGGAPTVAMLAVTFFAGGAAGALLHARLATGFAPRVVYVDGPAPSVPSTATPSAASPTAAAVPNATDSPLAPPPVPTAVVASPPQARLTQLDGERAVLDSARIALVSGDSEMALRALERHAKAYRQPLLGEEHDALLVQVLVQAGRFDEARSRAEAFRRKAPQSLLLPAVDAAIASIR